MYIYYEYIYIYIEIIKMNSNEPQLYSVHTVDVSLYMIHHQKFQVPKMQVLNLIRLFWGGFSLTQALHTAYIGEYLHFRYLKCLVNICLHKNRMYIYVFVYMYTHFPYFLSSCAQPGIIFYQRFA